MRRFESEAQRVALYAAVYETDFWKSEMTPKVGAVMPDPKVIVVKRIHPTKKSTVQ